MERRKFLRDFTLTAAASAGMSLGACATVPSLSSNGRRSPEAYLAELRGVLTRLHQADLAGALGPGTGSRPAMNASMTKRAHTSLLGDTLHALLLAGAGRDLGPIHREHPGFRAIVHEGAAAVDRSIIASLAAVEGMLSEDGGRTLHGVLHDGQALDDVICSFQELGRREAAAPAQRDHLWEVADVCRREMGRRGTSVFVSDVVVHSRRVLETRERAWVRERTVLARAIDDRWADFDHDREFHRSGDDEPIASVRGLTSNDAEAFWADPAPTGSTAPPDDPHGVLRSRCWRLSGQDVVVGFKDGTFRRGRLHLDFHRTPADVVFEEKGKTWVLDLEQVVEVSRILDGQERTDRAHPSADASMKPGTFVEVWEGAEVARRGWVAEVTSAHARIFVMSADGTTLQPEVIPFGDPRVPITLVPALPNVEERIAAERAFRGGARLIAVGLPLIGLGIPMTALIPGLYGLPALPVTAGIVLLLVGAIRLHRARLATGRRG